MANIASNIVKAVIKGNKIIRIVFGIAILFIIAGITINSLIHASVLSTSYTPLATALSITAIIGLIFLHAYQLNIDELEAKAAIKEVEEKIKENSNETTAAWELGRIKLESYLNRNLKQVQSIFIWTIIVMITGFIIIGYGILQVYHGGNASLNAGIITTTCGLIIEFIGATFLLIYKSTMQQAKDYVTVLERINAVGMSVQILDSISHNEVKLQDETKADIAKKLLELYGGPKS